MINGITTSVSQTTGGLNVNIKTFKVDGFTLLSSDFSIENDMMI